MSSPILVLLSPCAKLLNKNAMYMVRIWQNLSVDKLTSEMEQQLWEKETWNLKLLVNDIDPLIQKWIQDETYIFLYGGNDIEWIRAFIQQARSVASILNIHIEMVYVGISHNKDQVCRLQEIITTEKLSYCLPESSGAYFRSRLDSMIYSITKIEDMGLIDQLYKTEGTGCVSYFIFPSEGMGPLPPSFACNKSVDKLLEEIQRFKSHEEWALLAKGSTILVNGSGRIALNALEQLQKWKTRW